MKLVNLRLKKEVTIFGHGSEIYMGNIYLKYTLIEPRIAFMIFLERQKYYLDAYCLK